MTGRELASRCPLFDVLKDYYCVETLRRKGVYCSVDEKVIAELLSKGVYRQAQWSYSPPHGR